MAQLDGEQGIGYILDHLAVELHSEPLVENTLFEGIVVGVGEYIGEYDKPEVGLVVGHQAHGVGEGDVILAALLAVGGVGAVIGLGLLFKGDIGLGYSLLRSHVAEVFAVEEIELAFYIHLAVQVEARVRGVIVLFVGRDEVVVGQLDDMVGVTAGYRCVLAGLITLVEHSLIEILLGVAEGALHLVVHDALIVAAAVFILFDMPALLTEGVLVLVDKGTEHRVGVHRHQVLEILLVHARYGIHRLVGEGHRVEEGVQRALHQLDEGIVDGVFLGAAEHAVLEDMEHTGRVLRRGREGYRVCHVAVVVINIAQHGAALLVAHDVHIAAYFFDAAALLDNKAADLIAYVISHMILLLGKPHDPFLQIVQSVFSVHRLIGFYSECSLSCVRART